MRDFVRPKAMHNEPSGYFCPIRLPLAVSPRHRLPRIFDNRGTMTTTPANPIHLSFEKHNQLPRSFDGGATIMNMSQSNPPPSIREEEKSTRPTRTSSQHTIIPHARAVQLTLSTRPPVRPAPLYLRTCTRVSFSVDAGTFSAIDTVTSVTLEFGGAHAEATGVAVLYLVVGHKLNT